MKKLVLIIAVIAAYWYWNDGQLPLIKKPAAVDALGKPVVWIFTFNDCGAACQGAVQELKNRHAPFEEKRINPDDRSNANVKLWHAYKNGATFPIIVAGTASVNGFYVPAIATLLGKNFGDTFLTSDEKRFFKYHFNVDGSPKIVLYGTDWCSYCAALKQEFKSHHINFLEIDVEKSSEQNLMESVMGINGYPATWVGYSRVVKGEVYSEVINAVKNY